MTSNSRIHPAASQTVGPYFRIGLDWLIQRAPAEKAEGEICIRGKMIDRDGAPVPDGMLEFWEIADTGDGSSASNTEGQCPQGFRRVATGVDGSFSLSIQPPSFVPLADGRLQAPHLLVLVFARGLLRHLLTRVYLAGSEANESDPVLQRVPQERRQTLIAKPDDSETGSYRWNIVLQGDEETVFFAW